MRKPKETHKRNCLNCNVEFESFKMQFCSSSCRNLFNSKQKSELISGVEGEDYIICKWCNMKVTRIYGSHLKSFHPEKTMDDYRKEFPGHRSSTASDGKNVAAAYVRYSQSETGKRAISERVKGEKNPNSKVNVNGLTRKQRSPFSKEFYFKQGLSESETEISRKHFVSNALSGRITETQFEYWLEKTKGDAEEAKKLFIERQRTFTLEKCIEKYGEIEGRKKWIDRQEKWFSNYRKKSYSFVSQDLFWKLQEELQFNPEEIKFATFDNGKRTESVNINKEARLYLDTRVVLPDFIHFPSKKIIEFDGVYYHRNTPENKKREEKRDEDLRRNNYNVFHVNEKDYKDSPNDIILECIKFLKNE